MAMLKRDDCKIFGKTVRLKLVELEMTQTELANLTGIHPRYISIIINGKRPGLKHREKIRAVLGMPSVKKHTDEHSNIELSKSG